MPKPCFYSREQLKAIDDALHPHAKFHVAAPIFHFDGDAPLIEMQQIKDDLILFLLTEPGKIDALKEKLRNGKIDGTSYEHDLGGLLGSDDPESLREQWLLSIRQGDTPETNLIARITVEWIDEAIALREHIRRR